MAVRCDCSAAAAGTVAQEWDEELVAYVREIMHAYKLSQHDVVASSGLSGGQAAFSAWLNGRKVARLAEKQAQLRAWADRYTADAGNNSRFFHSFKVGAGERVSVWVATPHVPAQVGQRLDAQDFEGNWYAAAVRDVRPGAVLVHYARWSPEYDEWVPTAGTDRLAPLGTRTGGRTPRT